MNTPLNTPLNTHLFLYSLISVISIIHSQSSYQCDVSQCAKSNLASNQCIYSHPLQSNGTMYEISLQCSSGSFCPPIYEKANETCASINAPRELVEAEACGNNTNCASNICNNLKCQGVSSLGVCTASSQCGVSYYCGKLTNVSLVSNCLPQGNQGEPCDSDFACKNNMGCYGINATCIPYFSLADGSQVTEFDEMLCQNMKAVNGYCASTQQIGATDECLPFNGTLQTMCSYNVTGSTNTSVYQTPCQCSKAYANRNFCEYDTANPNWQKYISSLKSYFNGDAMNKHTVRRINMDFSLRRLQLTVGAYPQYKDADDCAINLDASAYLVKISSFIILVLVFIVFA